MISGMPALGIPFDISKLEGYGQECWGIFLRCTVPLRLRSVLLFHGDTSRTLSDRENVFCIAIHSVDKDIIDEIKTHVSKCEEFKKVYAIPNFVEDQDCTLEPLPEAGRINNMGNLEKGPLLYCKMLSKQCRDKNEPR